VLTIDDFDTYPDFPVPGILFYDIGPILRDPDLFSAACADLTPATGTPVDMIAGVDARGFIFAPMVAQRLHVGLTMVRKEGKMPGELLHANASIEYGAASLTLNPKGIAGKDILVVDDVLATGGTAAAKADLVTRSGGIVVGYSFLMELDFLHGREKLGNHKIVSLTHVE